MKLYKGIQLGYERQESDKMTWTDRYVTNCTSVFLVNNHIQLCNSFKEFLNYCFELSFILIKI